MMPYPCRVMPTLMCGAGDGVAIFDGDLAERTRAGLRILRSLLREAESRHPI